MVCTGRFRRRDVLAVNRSENVVYVHCVLKYWLKGIRSWRKLETNSDKTAEKGGEPVQAVKAYLKTSTDSRTIQHDQY